MDVCSESVAEMAHDAMGLRVLLNNHDYGHCQKVDEIVYKVQEYYETEYGIELPPINWLDMH